MFYIWLIVACFVGVFSGALYYEADIMWFEQGFTFGACATLGMWGWWRMRSSNLHYLYWKDNLGIGLTRVALWAAMLWSGFVLLFFGDSTIEGIWYTFYLVMAYAVVHIFGVKGAESFGVRLRVDVYERKNFAAATFIAAFTLATGMIFGGSTWGESTAESLEYGGIFEILPSYEDGWWIVPWFFIMGWILLFVTMKLWFIREKGVSGPELRQDRSMADARAAAVYCLAIAIPLTDAVAGDYYGLADSFIGFAVIALPVVGHEILRPASAAHVRKPQEPWLYVAFGIVAMILAPIISTLLGFRS